MQYLSPASLIGDSFQPPLDKKAIQLGKKRLLAELELNAGEPIQIRGILLDKNDIIGYFEELQKDNVVEYHQAIEEDIILLGFLEESVISHQDKFKDNPLYSEAPFIHWVSPYFFSAFTAYTDACFQHKDDTGLSAILGNPLLMTAFHLEQTWAFIAKILANNIALLEYYQDQKNRSRDQAVSIESVSHLMDYGYIRLIQLLPDNRLGELKDKYAFVIMQACIYTFNHDTENRYLAKTWMDNAESLAISPEMKREISEKLEEMNKVREKGNTANLGRLAWLGLFLLIKIVTCNSLNHVPSYNPSYNLQNAPAYIHLKGDSTRHLLQPYLDSVMKANRHIPAKRLPPLSDSILSTAPPPPGDNILSTSKPPLSDSILLMNKSPRRS